jgi:beta-phosphoglucomutase
MVSGGRTGGWSSQPLPLTAHHMFKSSKIRAIVFDLDGTLVETEHLKAEAYAELIGRVTRQGSPEPAAIELYRSIVGATDLFACDAMINRFALLPYLATEAGEEPRDALHRQRMAIYSERYGTATRLKAQVYAHNVELAQQAHLDGLSIAVATMSFSDEAERVLEAIGLSDIVQTVVGVDDVAYPKPAPDAFLLAMERLGVEPEETLIIEDSPRGTHAAASSGAHWLCVATPFSAGALRADQELDSEWIVWDPTDLTDAVAHRIP